MTVLGVQAPFERTMRALSAERRRRPYLLLTALLGIVAWVVWAAIAEVGVHLTSVAGRIEAREPVNVLRAEVDGRLVAVHAALGQPVRVGDVLYEIDDAEAAIRRAEAAARIEAIIAEREVLMAALAAANQARDGGQDVLLAALAEARAQLAQARAALTQAEREVTRLGGLVQQGGISPQELERARVAASLRRAEIGAAQALADRLSAESARDTSDRTAAVERMRQEHLRLEAEQATAEADQRSAELARERRRVRVPIAGRVGELPLLRPGDYVQTGQALGTIVPDGDLHVVAFFGADRALGWIRPGASARVRLDAFPWTWFGQVSATVEDVALEPKDGLLRVELALADGPADVPLGHGLTGEVEIEIEQASPLSLLLRAAGRQTRPETQTP